MTDYISRDAALKSLCGEVCNMPDMTCDRIRCIEWNVIHDVPAADVRSVVTCADCKHNNACLTQAFVEEASRVPFDRNTFFCADGKRADDA